MRRVILALVAAAVLALPAWATVVLRASVADLTGRAHRIVLGEVLSKDVVFERERGRIWTTWRVRADEAWLGAPDGDAIVSVPGGEAEGLTQDFEGGAKFEKGARVVVFLWKDDDGRFLVLGEAQGAFQVVRDAKTGEDRCVQSLDGLVLVDAAGRSVDPAPLRLGLDELRTQVADARRAREERERREREAEERRREERRRRAERTSEATRGRPGGPPLE